MKIEDLVEKIQENEDQELLLQLWKQSEKFVRRIARRYVPFLRCPDEEEDLLQEGYLAISQSVRMFNPDGGKTFLGFSAYFLHSAFSEYVGRQIGGSRGQLFRLRMLRRFEDEYRELTGRNPTDDKICIGLGITPDSLRTLRSIGSTDISIYTSGDDDDRTLLETIPSPEDLEESVIDRIVNQQVHDLLIGYINDLPELQRKIIYLIFFRNLTAEKTSEILGIDRNQLNNQKKRALTSLRVYHHKAELGRYLPERVGSSQYRGVNKNMWQSSTEKTVFKILELEEESGTRSRGKLYDGQFRI